jgi:preprotein translocase subunit SecD
MLDFPRWRIWMLNALIVFSFLLAIPSFLPKSVLDRVPSWIPKETINLGLDLAGGSHILLEADRAQLERDRLESLEEGVRTAMRRAEPKIDIEQVSRANGRLTFLVTDGAQIDAARKALEPVIANTSGSRDWNLEMTDGNRITLVPVGAGANSALGKAMDSAKDVIGRRINALGTLEPTIIRQGDDRIVVQVPGLQDPEALKALIGKTAKLEFKLVDEGANPDDTAKGKARVGSQALPYPDNPMGVPYIAVRRLGGIQGDQLTGAQQSFDQKTNEPVVNIQFNGEGGAKFARMTQANVGKLFAIVLDGQVISAPRINEAILGGSSQISGSFTVESANQLAISLNSGALPVDLKVVEERSVGAELGKDSIQRGLIAGIIGTLGVLVWMLLAYGRFGVYSCYALIINVAMILGVMALANATLTLPGIAGFVLTIGAAVDANVIINERIREERRRGRRVAAAVEHGYSEASRAIFDANITNVIAAVLMFFIGSGPIRGFAVVLMIGIVTSVFTAVTLTRMWVAGWVKRNRPQDINI